MTLTVAQPSMSPLDRLWQEVEAVTRGTDPGGLPPVMGGGQARSPRLACVFINPTARNASTRDGWDGPRWPWIGTRPVWRVLADAGLLPRDVQREIFRRPRWDEAFATEVYRAVAEEGLYLTNLVKWTGPNGDLPSLRLVALYEDLLQRELELVKPRGVVAFGGMTFRSLTGRQIKMGDVLVEARRTGRVPATDHRQLRLPVYPCFFPVGRGNPRGAVELLTVLKRQTRSSVELHDGHVS
jgi:hypothetical protein